MRAHGIACTHPLANFVRRQKRPKPVYRSYCFALVAPTTRIHSRKTTIYICCCSFSHQSCQNLVQRLVQLATRHHPRITILFFSHARNHPIIESGTITVIFLIFESGTAILFSIIESGNTVLCSSTKSSCHRTRHGEGWLSYSCIVGVSKHAHCCGLCYHINSCKKTRVRGHTKVLES